MKAAFEEKRKSHWAHLQEKKSETAQQKQDHAYQKFVKVMLPLENGGSARDRFRRVAEKSKPQTTSGEDAAALLVAQSMVVM